LSAHCGPFRAGDLPDVLIFVNCVKSLQQKYFSFSEVGSRIWFAHPAAARGAYRDRHGRWQQDAMAASTSQRIFAPTNVAEADGKGVWS
jgi:hypothetical protein